MPLTTRAMTRAARAARPGALLVVALLALAACRGGDPANVVQTDAAVSTHDDSRRGARGRPRGRRAIHRARRERQRGRGRRHDAADARDPRYASPRSPRALIASGAKVSARNSYGVSPLYLAARGADVGTVRELLAAGADANTALPEGEPVLMTAAKAGNVGHRARTARGRSAQHAVRARRGWRRRRRRGHRATARPRSSRAGAVNRADPEQRRKAYTVRPR